MITGIQVLGILFALGIIYLSYLFYRKKDFSAADFAVWAFIGLAVLVPVLFSESLMFLVEPLTFYRLFDLLTAGGFIILFAVVFRMYGIARKNERSIDGIVRALALREEKHKSKR
jgi:hypothetical protein